MKHLFTLLSFFVGLNAMAQLPVSQLQQKKKAIVEEYNGIHCQYCPDGHRISQEIIDADPENVIVINVHAGSLSSPSAGEYDFRTSYGSALAGQTGLTGYPSATINRHVFSGGETALGRGQWAGAVNTIKQQDAYVNVALEADIDVQSREITVNVELYYTGTSPVTENFLTIAVSQGNIRGTQEGVGDNVVNIDAEGNYIHDHALRRMITDIWGDTIETVSSGTLVEKTFTYTLDEMYANIPMDLGELEIIAFVSETRQEIINGASTHPTVSNFVNNVDGKFEKMYIPPVACDKLVAPVLTYRNNGNNTITSTQFEYTTNNGSSEVYNWSGNIQPGYSQEIEFPGISYVPSSNNISNVGIKVVNAVSDQDNSNDDIDNTFASLANHDATIYTLKLFTDQWASETSWNLKNSSGTVLYTSQPYLDLPSSGETERDFSFFLQRNKCYYFEMLDSYGDGLCAGSGNGSFELKHGNTVILSACDIGVKESLYWTTNPVSFEVEDLSVTETHDTEDGDPTVHNILTPNSIPLTLKWHLTDLVVPAGWTEEVAVCDAIECHVSTLTSYEYEITENGATALDVHFINNYLTGEGNASIIIYEVGDSANTVQQVDFHVEIVQATGVLDNNVRKVAVYPNPTSSTINVKGLESSEVQQIQIYNVLGDLVKTVPIIQQDITSINVSDLNNGMYLLKMYDQKNDLYLTQSFLKQ